MAVRKIEKKEYSGNAPGGKEIPGREFTVIEDTSTYRILKGIGRFRAGSVFTVLAVVVCVVLGIACVMRYAAIFDLTKHTRAIEKENTKQRNKLAVESGSVSAGETVSVDIVAASLGMVRPSEENVIKIPLTESNVTRVYLTDDEAASDEEDKGFYRSLLAFLGRTSFD